MGQADRQNRNARRERELEAEVRALRKKTGGERRGDQAAKKIHRHNFQTVEDKYRYVKAASKKALRGEIMPATAALGYYAWLTENQHAGNWCACTPLPGLLPGPPFTVPGEALKMADEGLRHPLPAKEGSLKATTNSPPQLSHRTKPAPTPVHFQPPPTKPGWATSPTSPPGKAGCISPLSRPVHQENCGYAFPSASTPSSPWTPLNMAVRRERPAPGLIFHSDQGVQYAAAAFRERLDSLGVRQSMSRKGDPTTTLWRKTFSAA